jgi:hypothetical protein
VSALLTPTSGEPGPDACRDSTAQARRGCAVRRLRAASSCSNDSASASMLITADELVGFCRKPANIRADQPRQLTGGGLATNIGRRRARGLHARGVLRAMGVAPSPQPPPKSSILASAASFGHGTEMRLGSGSRRCRLAQHGGQSWAMSSTIFCYSPVWHYSSRGLSSRPRACSSDAAPLLRDAPRAVCAST